MVAKLLTMGGLASHCHEKLTNTKRGEGGGREWRKINSWGSGLDGGGRTNSARQSIREAPNSMVEDA